MVAARMHEFDLVGVATIANGMHSLIRGKEDSHALVLLQCGSFFDDRMSITRSAFFVD